MDKSILGSRIAFYNGLTRTEEEPYIPQKQHYKMERLTFGVELEFLVASIDSPNHTPPEPAPGKIIHFPKNDEDKLSKDSAKRAIRRHIVDTFQKAGFDTALKEGSGPGLYDYTKWGVKGDATIEADPMLPWKWTDVEVVSPIFFVTERTSKKTSALHVHIGDGKHNFSFLAMLNLISFLWAFERQLNSLHQIWRIDSKYASSLRNRSKVAEDWYCAHGERPFPLQGVALLRNPNTIEELCDAASHPLMPRYGAYNFRGVKTIAGGRKIGSNSAAKPTVEFRQHRGTLEEEAVTVWIKTVAGIVQFIKDVSPESFVELICVTEHETWEKSGGPEDQKRERELGLILAESRFTAVDLLQHIGLEESAEYYDGRMNEHIGIFSQIRADLEVVIEDGNGGSTRILARDLPPLLRTWDYETDTGLSPEEYRAKKNSRRTWEAWKRLDTHDWASIDLVSDSWPSGRTIPVPRPVPEFEEFLIEGHDE